MELIREPSVGRWISIDPTLESLLSRLEEISLQNQFTAQRTRAFEQALHLYLEPGTSILLKPLVEEIELARLYLFADYYPNDGQLTLIEQLRDIIEVHISEEERRWLDPVKHSYMDLLEVQPPWSGKNGADLLLRSLGSDRQFTVKNVTLERTIQVGQVLLTRLIWTSEAAYIPGTAVLLAHSVARTILEVTNQERREMEATTGSFNLGEWEELVKPYGYLLLWNVAQARFGTLIKSEKSTSYRTPTGTPFLYAVALYEHHEIRLLTDGFSQFEEWEKGEPTISSGGTIETMVLRGDPTEEGEKEIVGRATLTPSQLFIECDTPERLNRLKHTLASAFGFSLHFRGETTVAPMHQQSFPDIEKDHPERHSIVVDKDEEYRLLASFLENLYFDWSDRPSPALGGETPRHGVIRTAIRDRVEGLISEIEGHDIALRRVGKSGYDYNRLRAHVGLDMNP